MKSKPPILLLSKMIKMFHVKQFIGEINDKSSIV